MSETLRCAVDSHSGYFICEEIGQEQNTREVRFRHGGSSPDSALAVPDVPGLKEFYETYEYLTMYVDEQSGDAAYFLASPLQWSELDECFRPWLEGLEEDEVAGCFPSWINDCIVVGEIPQSGNYLLVPASGADIGKVFEFDHDGFEFLEMANSLYDFVMRMLDLDSGRLTRIASHLRFITADNRQWWIREMRDNRGNAVLTEIET